MAPPSPMPRRALGHKAEIFVPTIASPAKVARLKSYGATVTQVGTLYVEARTASEKRAAETGALTVHAYEDPGVFAGAGSVALEFAEQSKFDTLLVAVGGGGLIAGCAAALGGTTKIVAIETEGTPTLFEARRAGRPVRGRDLRRRRRCAGRQPDRHAQLRAGAEVRGRRAAGHRRCRPCRATRAVGRAARDRRARPAPPRSRP